jgi:hypothetical protein
MAVAAILIGLLGEPALAATKQKRTHLAHPKPQAQREIICNVIIHGCREVKKGCRIEISQSQKQIGAVQVEVCD